MNISINFLGPEGKKSWDGNELIETIQMDRDVRKNGISDGATGL